MNSRFRKGNTGNQEYRTGRRISRSLPSRPTGCLYSSRSRSVRLQDHYLALSGIFMNQAVLEETTTSATSELPRRLPVGAEVLPGNAGVSFRVWAPRRQSIDVVFDDDQISPT